jgi:hypothetical protein
MEAVRACGLRTEARKPKSQVSIPKSHISNPKSETVAVQDGLRHRCRRVASGGVGGLDQNGVGHRCCRVVSGSLSVVRCQV